VAVLVGVDAAVKKRHQGIDQDESHVILADEVFQHWHIAGQDRRPLFLFVADANAAQDVNTVHVRAGSVQPRADGAFRIIFGVEQQDAGRLRYGPVARVRRHRPAAADAGGDVAPNGRFAVAGVAVGQRQHPAWNATGPEPLDATGLHVGEAAKNRLEYSGLV